MSVQVSTPIYRDKGIFYKDSGCTQPFTDQESARVLWRQKHGEPFVDAIKRWVSGFMFLFLIGACIAFWNFTEEQGWRSHDQLARVSASEWAQGEYKSCATSVYWGFRTMPISVPGHADHLFRDDGDHDSGMMPITRSGLIPIS
jgi:hypothetical protein